MPEPDTHRHHYETRSTRPAELIPPQRSAGPAARTGQDAELASLIRRLAVIRPEILTPCEAPQPPDTPPSAPPQPSDTRPPAPTQPLPARPLRPAAETVSAARLPRTRNDFPVDHESLATIDRLHAMTNGAHKPDAYWPRHADGEFRARMRRPPLRRRLPRALERWTRLTCMATGALTLTAFPIAAVALMVLSTPAV